MSLQLRGQLFFVSKLLLLVSDARPTFIAEIGDLTQEISGHGSLVGNKEIYAVDLVQHGVVI